MFCGGETEQTLIIANKISVIFEDNYLPFKGGSRATNGRQGLGTCVHDFKCSVSLTEKKNVCNVQAFYFYPISTLLGVSYSFLRNFYLSLE